MSRLAAVRTLPHRAEVLLDPEARRRAGRRRGRVVRGRAREPRIELGERREAGAPEPIDRLVVVADDHDVVGPVGRPAEQLDELDLGDVGVLELVDQDVAELALPAAQDVGAGLEQPGDGGDLLAEVEGAAARELVLVGSDRRRPARSGGRPRARRRRRRRSRPGCRCVGWSSSSGSSRARWRSRWPRPSGEPRGRRSSSRRRRRSRGPRRGPRPARCVRTRA